MVVGGGRVVMGGGGGSVAMSMKVSVAIGIAVVVLSGSKKAHLSPSLVRTMPFSHVSSSFKV